MYFFCDPRYVESYLSDLRKPIKLRQVWTGFLEHSVNPDEWMVSGN